MSASLWQVQVRGRASDLEHLARHFTSSPVKIAKDSQKDGFLYESDSFTACSSSEQVLALADEELAVLSGVLKLVRNSHEPLRSGAVYKPNAAGGQDVFVHIRETLQVRVELGEPTITVTDSQGNAVPLTPPPPRTLAIARLTATDPAIAKAMRLLAADDAKSWVGMYRIHEVIEAEVGGEHALKKRGWGDLKRFKHSANSVKVAGDTARHGKELDSPPTHPMSLDEAHAYLRYVLEAWLASKGV